MMIPTCLKIFTHSDFPSAIDSCGHASEFRTSGTKHFMNGHILHKICAGKNGPILYKICAGKNGPILHKICAGKNGPILHKICAG